MNKSIKNEELNIGDEWQTPPDLWNEMAFRYFNPEYGIFDPCPGSKRLDWCLSHQDNPWVDKDGLKADWVGQVFVNPPFSDIKPWVEKMVTVGGIGNSVLMILPMRSDQPWFHLLKNHADLTFIRGRVQYVGGKRKGCSFPSFLAFIKEGRGVKKTKVDFWWPKCHQERGVKREKR